MELITYREIYHEPVMMIPVPKNLQNQAFEVFFAPVISEKQYGHKNEFNLSIDTNLLDKKPHIRPKNLKNLVLSWDTLPEDLHDAFNFADLPSDNSEIF